MKQQNNQKEDKRELKLLKTEVISTYQINQNTYIYCKIYVQMRKRVVSISLIIILTLSNISFIQTIFINHFYYRSL